MDVANNVTDSDLPRLKQLASDLLAVDAPELAVLDQIAALAAEIAGRGREAVRRRLLDRVIENAQAIFAASPGDLRSRLEQSPLDALSDFGSMLDGALSAGTAFLQADAALLAARERGDYAAMAPLAMEADATRKTLAHASADFAKRLGLDEPLTPEALAAQPPAAPVVDVPASEEPLPTEAGVLSGEGAVVEMEPGQSAEAQPERRRLRALIRQMRPLSEAS